MQIFPDFSLIFLKYIYIVRYVREKGNYFSDDFVKKANEKWEINKIA